MSAFIGSGDNNTLVGSDSVITGGSLNTVGFKGNGSNGINAPDAATGGGYSNKITSAYGTIGGGYGNSVTGLGRDGRRRLGQRGKRSERDGRRRCLKYGEWTRQLRCRSRIASRS